VCPLSKKFVVRDDGDSKDQPGTIAEFIMSQNAPTSGGDSWGLVVHSRPEVELVRAGSLFIAPQNPQASTQNHRASQLQSDHPHESSNIVNAHNQARKLPPTQL